VPATGPYMIQAITPTRVELVRNPYFHEWSRTAKPDGYPDRIAIDIDANPSDQDKLISQVEEGKADSFLNLVAPQRAQELMTHYTNHLHLYPPLSATFLFINPTRPPSDDVRVQQPANTAVDRTKTMQRAGGP